MTKQAYFEMCNALNTDIVEKEIPPDFDDLCFQSQDSIQVFHYLPDKWDYMSGNYLGKDITNIVTIYNLLEISESYWLLILELLNIIVEEKKNSIKHAIQKEVDNRAKDSNKKSRSFSR